MSTAKRVVALFLESGIESRVAENIKPVLWHKLFVNVGINAVTALTGIRNGQLLDSEHSRQLVAAAVGEAVAVARMLDIGIDKKKDTIIEQVFAVAVATASNRSSMGQDLDRHSPTEIDAINGYIVRRAEELNIPVPVNRTLTGLIKVKEKSWEEEERNHFVPDK
jgi:2-dehydropantoate 2-reductase